MHSAAYSDREKIARQNVFHFAGAIRKTVRFVLSSDKEIK
jgi:hypothetical protein